MSKTAQLLRQLFWPLNVDFSDFYHSAFNWRPRRLVQTFAGVLSLKMVAQTWLWITSAAEGSYEISKTSIFQNPSSSSTSLELHYRPLHPIISWLVEILHCAGKGVYFRCTEKGDLRAHKCCSNRFRVPNPRVQICAMSLRQQKL